MAARKRRVGWIINNRPRFPFIRHPDTSYGGVAAARYHWLAEAVNTESNEFCYELYRPWRRYAAVVFMKAFGPREHSLAVHLQSHGTVVIQDENVNYYERGGVQYYEGMGATEEQRSLAIEMTRDADAVICDSEYLLRVCRQYNNKCVWVPDNVNTRMIPDHCAGFARRGRMPILWSGEAVKLFELLSIRSTLERYASHIELIMITNDLQALSRWKPEYRTEFEHMMNRINHRYVEYRSLQKLLTYYCETPGVFVSPRFLDNPYNLGHTEWKITLPMACHRPVLASPLRSYCTVADRAGASGVRICDTAESWDSALEEVVSGKMPVEEEGRAARGVVDRYYATDVVARQHEKFLQEMCNSTH